MEGIGYAKMQVLRIYEKDWHDSMVVFAGQYKLQEEKDIQRNGTIRWHCHLAGKNDKRKLHYKVEVFPCKKGITEGYRYISMVLSTTV